MIDNLASYKAPHPERVLENMVSWALSSSSPTAYRHPDISLLDFITYRFPSCLSCLLMLSSLFCYVQCHSKGTAEPREESEHRTRLWKTLSMMFQLGKLEHFPGTPLNSMSSGPERSSILDFGNSLLLLPLGSPHLIRPLVACSVPPTSENPP